MATRAPLRLLVVCPSWVGDAVMATPSLRMVRRAFPGAFIGGLVRPGIDQVLAGSDFFDELHVAHPGGVMGPKFTAAKLRPRRYDTALLLTNSFSTALVTRIAGVPRRIGYDRDGRGLLLTDKLQAPKLASGRWAPIPAVEYYLRLARLLLHGPGVAQDEPGAGADPVYLELATTDAEERAADEVLARAEVPAGAAYAVLNPGGNNPAKRWPADRFAALADDLRERHGLEVVVNGSPAEGEVVEAIRRAAKTKVFGLPQAGITLAALKAVVRRARLMVTNDTGPRHIAAAFGVPLVSLFGPTDPRWTTIPTRPGRPEAVITADPSLPPTEVADDHPERCRIDRITIETVRGAVERVLKGE